MANTQTIRDLENELETARETVRHLEWTIAYLKRGVVAVKSSASPAVDRPVKTPAPDKSLSDWRKRFTDAVEAIGHFAHKSEIQSFFASQGSDLTDSTMSNNLSRFAISGALSRVRYNRGYFYGLPEWIAEEGGRKRIADEKYRPQGEAAESIKWDTEEFL